MVPAQAIESGLREAIASLAFIRRAGGGGGNFVINSTGPPRTCVTYKEGVVQRVERKDRKRRSIRSILVAIRETVSPC